MLSDPAPEGHILTLEIRRAQALIEGDLAMLEDLTADPYTHVESTGVLRTRTQFLEGLRTGQYRFSRFEIQENHVRVVGDVAIVAGRYLSDIITPDGRQPTKYARHLRVWAIDGGRWRNLAHQATAMPTP
jgi:hypothetical protein